MNAYMSSEPVREEKHQKKLYVRQLAQHWGNGKLSVSCISFPVYISFNFILVFLSVHGEMLVLARLFNYTVTLYCTYATTIDEMKKMIEAKHGTTPTTPTTSTTHTTQHNTPLHFLRNINAMS